MALRLDHLKRVRNIHWATGAYAIIIAEGSYATIDIDEKWKLIATQTDPEVTGITGAPVTATLLDCPANADPASLDAKAGKPDAPERVDCIVVPKTKDAETNWFNMYVKPISGERKMPDSPFFWLLNPMLLPAPRQIYFNFRVAPHLLPSPGAVSMAQLVPSAEAIENKLMGYSVWAYRTDGKGTEQIFQSPPEWATDVITDIGGRGLLFGKNPPLIADDIPMPP